MLELKEEKRSRHIAISSQSLLFSLLFSPVQNTIHFYKRNTPGEYFLRHKQ